MPSTGKGAASRADRLVEIVAGIVAGEKRSGVGLGVSGGMDSMTLLHILCQLRGRTGLSVTAIHVQHNLRSQGEHRRDRRAIERECGRAGVGVHVVALPPGHIAGIAERKHCGIEAAAREARFFAFAQALQELGLRRLLLAHHGDDQVETVLMRLFLGAGLRGLSGMTGRQEMSVAAAGSTFTLLRPLLTVSRNEIADYARANGVRYCRDSTNRHLRFLRNRVRQKIVPFLLRHFPYLHGGVGALVRQNVLQQEYIAKETERAVPWEEIDGGFRVKADVFTDAHPAIQISALYSVATQYAGTHRIPLRFLEYIIRQCGEVRDGEGARGKVIGSGHGAVVKKAGGYLYWLVSDGSDT